MDQFSPGHTQPPALTAIYHLIMAAQQPMLVAWGPDLTSYYNDSFIPILGRKHPDAYGQPYRDIWSEVWLDIEPMIASVLAGKPAFFENMPFALEGRELRPIGWFSFSLTPLRDGSGTIAGFFVVVVETTETVLVQQRQAFGLQLEQALSHNIGLLDIMQAAADLLGPHLGVARCAFAIVDDAASTLTIEADWTDNQVPGLAGEQSLAVFSPRDLAALREGETVRTSGDSGPAGGWLLPAAIVVPFVRAGRLDALLLVDQPNPRHWTDEEAILVQDVASRTWAVAAQARAELALLQLNQTLELRVAERTIERDRIWRNAQELIAVCDGSYNFVSVNPACLSMLGYAADEMVGRSVYEFLHPDNQAATQARVGRYEPGQRRYIENCYRHRDGTWRDIAWNVVLEDGLFYATGRDITTERAVMAALHQSQARLQAIFETSYQLKGLLDPDGRVVAMNATALDAMGQDYARVDGQVFWDTAWFSATPGMSGQIRAAVLTAAQGNSSRFEIEVVLPTGSRRYDLSIRPIRGQDSMIIAIMTEAIDITERRATEEALRQSQKMEAVGQLTGGLAHDFNNLLTGIGGALELMQTRLAQGRAAEIPAYVSAAQQAAARAAALTHRLLAFSRRQTLLPRRLDANRLVADMADLVCRTVGPAITVRLSVAADLPAVLVDANQLENAVLNLCLNARDAMPDGGLLTIGTGLMPCIPGLLPGPAVAVTVTDTGTGMAPDIVARAFDPFYTTKPTGTGTGLGLSMVYGFARQSGGEAQISSTPGAGTIVTLLFPAEPDPVADPAENAFITAPPQPILGGGRTVLVVDDEEVIRALIQDVLSEYGYRTILAEDGQQALQHLQSSTRIDLLVTDIGLPGTLNGRQVADAARALHPGLPILIMTGYAEATVLGSGQLTAGMTLITKPFTMAALTLKIQELLPPS